jgi:hypothetical protein
MGTKTWYCPPDSVRWSLLLGYKNYIMHCFLFPFIFKIKVKQKEKIEKINALVENKMYKHDNKWCYIHELNL